VSLRLLGQGLRPLSRCSIISPKYFMRMRELSPTAHAIHPSDKSKHVVIQDDSNGICGRYKQLELQFRAQSCLTCDVDCLIRVPGASRFSPTLSLIPPQPPTSPTPSPSPPTSYSPSAHSPPPSAKTLPHLYPAPPP